MIFFYWLIWILPLVQHPLWGRRVGPFTIFEYIGIVCLVYGVLHILSVGRVRSLFSAMHVNLFFVLYFIALVSALTNNAGINLVGSAIIIYTSSFFLFIITVSLVDTLDRLRWTALAFIGSYGFASLYVIREWQVGRLIWANFRPGWIVGDANFFSTAAVIPVALAFYLAQSKGPRFQKAYCWGCMLLTVIAIILGASRGGFLGLAVASILVIWRMRHRGRNLALAAVLIIPLSVVLPVSPLHRLLRTGSSGVGSEQFHLQAWSAGLAMIESHPFFGVGVGNFKPLMPQYAPPGTHVDTLAHNMFIEVAAELGLPALLLFLGVFYFSYRTLGNLRKRQSAPLLVRQVATAMQPGLIGFAVAGSFVSAEYQKTTWFAFALMASLVPLGRLRASVVPDRLESPLQVEDRAEDVVGIPHA